jgi:hypothetical protein
MTDRVFIQRSRLGRTILVLRDSEIEVTVSNPNQSRSERFPLGTISSDYAVQSVHFNFGVVALFFISVAGIAWAIVLSRLGGPFSIFAMYVAIFAGAMALAGVRLIPRFDRFVFSDHWKRPLFFIARERGQREECDKFVRELLSRIERTGASAEPAVPKPPLDFEEAVDAEPEWKWKVSVVAGAATLVATIAGVYDPDVASVAFFLVIGGPMCVGVSAWQSFAEKERHSQRALLGVALALIAVGIAWRA